MNALPVLNQTATLNKSVDLSKVDFSFFQRAPEFYEEFSDDELTLAYHNFFSEENLLTRIAEDDETFNAADVDGKGNVIIDLSRHFKWIERLIGGHFKLTQHVQMFERLSKRLSYAFDKIEEEQQGKKKSPENDEEAELTNYMKTVFSRPQCSEIDEDTYSGLCQLTPFRHKIINYEVNDRTHVIRGVIVPSMSLIMLGLTEIFVQDICKKEPKFEAIFYHTVCTMLTISRGTLRQLSVVLLVNGYQDTTGRPFAPSVVNVQKALSYVWWQYKGLDCVDTSGAITPIQHLTPDVDLRYIVGKTVAPDGGSDTAHVFEFALFPGNLEGEIGYVEVNRFAKLPYISEFYFNVYRYSYKHIGNLDSELQKYYLDRLSIVELFRRGFSDMAKSDVTLLAKIALNFRLISAKTGLGRVYNENDDRRHPVMAPLIKLYINHNVKILGFNTVIHTVDHEEPISMEFEMPS